jgi:hypothetical protein
MRTATAVEKRNGEEREMQRIPATLANGESIN